MNLLQNLVQNEMDALGVKRSELVIRMGYSNISKGIRRLVALLDTLAGRDRLLPLLQHALYIPDEKFQTAVSALEEEIHAKYRAVFKPYIGITPNGEPRHYSFFSRKPWWMVNIEISEYLSSLPTDQELSVVCGLCKTHRLRYEVEVERVNSNKSDDQNFERASENLLSLPTDQGLTPACKVCGRRRKRFKEEIKGFIYYRNYDESFEFDQDCFLVKHNVQHGEYNQDSLTKAVKKY